MPIVLHLLLVMGYSLFVTFNSTCAQMIFYGLPSDTISAVEYFWTKNSIQYLWIWKDIVTNVLYDGQHRVWWSHFWILLAVAILQRQTLVRCVLVRDYFSKIEQHLQNKTLHLAPEYILSWSVGSKFTKFDGICTIACTRQLHTPCCKECVECLSFHVPCFEAVSSTV